MPSSTPFRLKKVCADCPFRADCDFHGLRPGRVADIAASLREGAAFHCHKTLDYDRAHDPEADGEEETNPITDSSQFCAGALATMERGDTRNTAVQLGERLGLRDPDDFDAYAQPVFNSLTEWAQALTERDRNDGEGSDDH